MERIPAAVALRRKIVAIDDVMCALCDFGEETVDHLVTSCMVASVLWQLVRSWRRVPNFFTFSFRDIFELHSHIGLLELVKEVFHDIIIIGCWSRWKARNELKFNNKMVQIKDIISKIKSVGFLWLNSISKVKPTSWWN
ncbi:uncharacterized protein LOC110883418 [Helianthus annuus]|uniref:uncharacterized protein LOC110883418 n=1 Tax=Helianthus annuus TaxID=4232 RepID=UPI000B907907|nr:uncharacterized protein LOC110883418 [Helianthus annuus]